ncbi:hypothetical protein IMZ16_01625 [Cruoricaptor ignavus]|uniref:Uncharacterized protein n=1 Tax=Cruoricaptor ignavus TaxID=1118202 RepID=A0A7M1T351_9FLAO|nr:hypothetical protein [Cruoricaptor ignavus]QOR74171.1 hypothetical protein IMZ16_01625 [Cruoricaptor ignavus]
MKKPLKFVLGAAAAVAASAVIQKIYAKRSLFEEVMDDFNIDASTPGDLLDGIRSLSEEEYEDFRQNASPIFRTMLQGICKF